MEKFFKNSKTDNGIPVVEANRPDQFTTSEADSTDYLRWRTPGTFDESNVFTEDITKKMIICRIKVTAGVGKSEAAFDTWANRAAANYVPWSLRKQILK